jgi:hypothetical protein
MLIQLTVFVPAVIAIYAATGAWVFSCDPISKTVDIVRGGLLYGWRRFVHVRAGGRDDAGRRERAKNPRKTCAAAEISVEISPVT